MTLKDRLNEALAAASQTDKRRQDALHAAVNAGDTDEEIRDALERLIEAREQKAAAFDHAGQPDLAATERNEAASLREFLPGAPGTSGPVTSSKRGGPLLSRTQMIFGVAALAAVAVAAFVMLHTSDQTDLSATPSGDKITLFKDDHTLGNPKAPITLLEYAAPMCPHCARFTLDEFPQLKREFIDTGKVFYVFRVFPLGAPDGAVEGIARCLPPERYFPYFDMMFREQSQWDPDGYQIADVSSAIIKLAAREGLSEERAKQCMADPAQQERINQVAQDAQLRYQIEGTPTFVMNGQVVNLPPGQKIADVLRLRINSLSGASTP